MARYINNLFLNKPADFVAFMMNDYLQKNGFSMADYKGQPAYRAGDPMLEGYKFIIWGYDGSTLHVEAWLKGPFGGEMDFTGFVAALQKKPFKDSLEQLFYLMNQPLPGEWAGGQPAAASYGQPAGMPGGAPVPVQTVDNSGPAVWALVFGVLSVLTCLFLPYFSIIFSALGVSKARLSNGSSKAGVAKVGQVLSIIGAAIAAVMLVFILINAIMLIIK